MIGVDIEEYDLDPGTRMIKLSGEVDLYAAPELKDRIDRAVHGGTDCLLIQFADGTFIDSTILGVLLGGLRQLRGRGGSLHLVCSDKRMVRIFTVTGLDKKFPIYARVVDALPAPRSTSTAAGNGAPPRPVEL
jgi:anti-sigma B factor antagonist